MKIFRYIFLLTVLIPACNNNRGNEKNELVLFCAASLTDVISEITSDFEKENNVEVKLNLASSGTLARQIEHGANPSIYISANKKWVDYLNQKNLTIYDTEKKIAGNSMVLVAPAESELNPVDFPLSIPLPELFEGKLSVGDPNHVPAGNYAVQLLENLGWKEKLEPRILPAKDVRSALMVVELGEAEAGIVYKTDALKSEKVKIIAEFPDSLYQPVNYYMVVIQGGKNKKSLSLYNYIMSEEAEHIWKKYGFSI
ncbi:MAG TPA: molybdate ABC transporter substrate-binding protein [Tangfeifania sp.]|nr:molybdate ABC transporter substrate-binding protein [Tangfeifania sp.]